MKLHRNLVEAVVRNLQLIFADGKYADKVIEKSLASNKRWGARDRGFIAETTYEMVRWWRLLLYLGQTDDEMISDKKLWRLVGIWHVLNDQGLPSWEEFTGIKSGDVQRFFEKAKKIRKVKQSIPDWLDEIGEKELGEEWDKELNALNRQAQVIIRVNTLKTTKAELQRLLFAEEIETATLDGITDGLVLKKRINIFTTPHFKNGFFEIQDAASQLVAPFLQVDENMRVVDACAGAGGKTLHLASLMENKGKILALDVEDWKLTELKKRTRRNGIENVENRLIENNKTIKRMQNSADRLLLDVPCSGLGVLRRNPDAKWKLDIDFINSIKNTQQEILQTYTQILKKGGKFVYATCSILPSESEDQVKKFLTEHKGEFELEDEQRISPSQSGFDGFYMARVVRK